MRIFCRIKRGVCRNDFCSGFGPIFERCYRGPKKCSKLAGISKIINAGRQLKSIYGVLILTFNFTTIMISDKRVLQTLGLGLVLCFSECGMNSNKEDDKQSKE